MKRIEQAHQAERFQPHVQQIFLSTIPFIQLRQRGDLLTDLRIGWQITGVIAVLHPQLPGGFSFCGEILGLFPSVHQTGGQQRDLTADSYIRHVL